MKTLEVIAPVFNEEDCIEEFITSVTSELLELRNYETSILLIENGSTSSSLSLIENAARKNKNLRFLKLSRNFGMDGALSAGLAHTNADLVVMMASDLQDDPAYIHEFIRKYEEGFDNVYGIVKKRKGVSLIRRINSQLFYLIAGKLTGSMIPRNASDYRLITRKVYTSVNSLSDSNRILRSLIAWVGFKSVGIEINRPPRLAGKSKAHTFKVLGIASKAILSNSYSLLRIASLLGIVLSITSVLSLFITTILFLTRGVPFPGFGTITSLIILLFGLLFLLIGILSEYVALIYEEVKNRPIYILDKE